MKAWVYSHPRRGTCFPECLSYGRCHCGCGQPTHLATCNRRSLTVGYWTTGAPLCFLRGHNREFVRHTGPGNLTRNGVPAERVRPLIGWLIARYDTKQQLADILGISPNTLQSWYPANGGRGVKHMYPKDAQRIVELVAAHKTSADPYAEYDVRRVPTPAERAERAYFDPIRVQDRRNTQALRDRRRAS